MIFSILYVTMMQRCKLKQLILIEFFWQYIHSSIIVTCISSTVQHTPESPIWQKIIEPCEHTQLYKLRMSKWNSAHLHSYQSFSFLYIWCCLWWILSLISKWETEVKDILANFSCFCVGDRSETSLIHTSYTFMNPVPNSPSSISL